MFGLGAFEIIVLCFLGLLIFGKRLPEVGKNLGKSIVEFKKGLANVEEQSRPQNNQQFSYNQFPQAQQAPTLPPNQVAGQAPMAQPMNQAPAPVSNEPPRQA